MSEEAILKSALDSLGIVDDESLEDVPLERILAGLDAMHGGQRLHAEHTEVLSPPSL